MAAQTVTRRKVRHAGSAAHPPPVPLCGPSLTCFPDLGPLHSSHWSCCLPIQIPQYLPKQPFFLKKISFFLPLFTNLEWLTTSPRGVPAPGHGSQSSDTSSAFQPGPLPAFENVPDSLNILFLGICAPSVGALPPNFSSCVIPQPFAKLSLPVVSREPDVLGGCHPP